MLRLSKGERAANKADNERYHSRTDNGNTRRCRDSHADVPERFKTLGVGDSRNQTSHSIGRSVGVSFGGMDMQALLAGMPLRTLATFSGGKMDNTMLEGLIQMLNQKLLGE